MVRAILLSALIVLACRPAAAQPFVIQMIAEPDNPYVQQQVVLTVRFFRESPFLTGYFVAPEIEGALVEELEVKPTVTVQRDGRDMEMLEKTYLVFPQARGRLTIPGMVFSGREVFAQAKPVELVVQPPPEGVGRHWMPAKSLTAREEWRLPDGPLEAGMSFERRVVYEAVGLMAAQLPSQEFNQIDGIELERLPPILEDRIEKNAIVGRRVERIILTPLTGGTLGAISETVTWWDTIADQPRYIHLPGRALRIKGLPLPELEDEEAPPAVRPLLEEQEGPRPQTLDETMMLVAAFTLLFGILFVRWLVRWSEPFWARRRAVAAWERAQRRGDLPRVRQALLEWGQVVWCGAPPRGLREIAGRTGNPALATYVAALERALYGKAEKIPTADFNAVKKALRETSVKTTSAQGRGLPPLNPV